MRNMVWLTCIKYMKFMAFERYLQEIKHPWSDKQTETLFNFVGKWGVQKKKNS